MTRQTNQTEKAIVDYKYNILQLLSKIIQEQIL